MRRVIHARIDRLRSQIPEGCPACRAWPLVRILREGDSEPPTHCAECGRVFMGLTRVYVLVVDPEAVKEALMPLRQLARRLSRITSVREPAIDPSVRVYARAVIAFNGAEPTSEAVEQLARQYAGGYRQQHGDAALDATAHRS